MNDLPEKKKRFRSVSAKLLAGVLAISSCLTLTTTIIQVYSDYSGEINDLGKRLDQIEPSYGTTIATSMWSYNEQQIQANLAGILSLPDVKYVQLIERGKVAYQKGEMPTKVMQKSFTLSLERDGARKEVGSLDVFASLEHIDAKIKDRLILIIISQSIKTFLASFLILILVNFLIVRHLTTIRRFFENYSTSAISRNQLTLHKKHSTDADELDMLANSVNSMITALNDFFDHLEQKIQERTHELWVKTRDIKSILENMRQGVFTINSDLTIGDEYSRHLEQILESDRISGRSIDEMLFKPSNLSANQTSCAISVLHTALHEKDMMFHMNDHLLPRNIVYNMTKQLELEWNVIENKHDIVEKILVMVKDITEISRLKEERELHKFELEIIDRVLDVTVERFIDFNNTALQEIRKCKAKLASREQSQEILSSLFIVLHTLKGNARTYGFKTGIVDALHHAESYCMKLRDASENVPWDFEHLERLIADVESDFRKIEGVVEKKLRSLVDVSEANAATMQQLDAVIKENLKLLDRDKVAVFDRVIALRKKIFWQPLATILHPELASLPEIAKSLGKPPPTVTITDKGIVFEKSSAPLLRNIFLHCLRNSIDHGIEPPEIRRLADKNPEGSISIEITVGDTVTMCVYDDGKGLNIKALRMKAEELNLISPAASDAEIADTIFSPGVSSAATLTDISGRGVGMDAVRKFVTGLGGRVYVEFTEAQAPASDFRKFRLVISMPTTHCSLFDLPTMRSASSF